MRKAAAADTLLRLFESRVLATFKSKYTQVRLGRARCQPAGRAGRLRESESAVMLGC